MGQWFSRFFKERGFKVTITSRQPIRAKRIARKLGVEAAELDGEAIASSDIILLSTPPAETAKIIGEIAEKMRKKAILLEISSVKADVVKPLEEAVRDFNVEAVSIHPMFGPGAKTIQGHRIIVIPVKGCLKTARSIARFFREAGAAVTLAKDFHEHEKMVALTLALPHFINLVFASALAASKNPIREVLKYAGTTFTLQKIVSESVISEDPNLYAAIQMRNERFRQTLSQLASEFSRLKNIVEKQDVEAFSQTFERLRKYFSGDSDYKRAYELFYRALEAVKQL